MKHKFSWKVLFRQWKSNKTTYNIYIPVKNTSWRNYSYCIKLRTYSKVYKISTILSHNFKHHKDIYWNITFCYRLSFYFIFRKRCNGAFIVWQITSISLSFYFCSFLSPGSQTLSKTYLPSPRDSLPKAVAPGTHPPSPSVRL